MVGAGVVLAGAVAVNLGYQTGRIAPAPADEVTEAWAILTAPPAQRDVAEAERLARRALERQPLQSRAASLLGVVKEEAGDHAAATRLMHAAANLSHRDDIADSWVFEDALKAGDYERAALHADALLRREPGVGPQYLYPRMIPAFAQRGFAEAMGRRLAKAPPWRPTFLYFATNNLQNPQAAFTIFEAIQKGGGHPTPEELGPYYRRLLTVQDYDRAYLHWVLFLPPEMVSKLQNVYDGAFEGWPESPPFGWIFGQGVRGSIESSEAYGRPGMALRVDYDGVSAPTLPSQFLLLAPARYRLSGLALTATPQSPGRVAWTIKCDKGETLVQTAPVADTKGAWQKFSAEFVVPEACRGQILSLTPLPSGERSTVEVWFDQIAIDRVTSDS